MTAPRRMLTVGVLSVATLLTPLPWLPLLLTGALALHAWEAGTSTLRRVAWLVPLAALIVGFNGLVLPHLYDALGQSMGWDPWRVGVATALRLSTLAVAASWFQVATEPRELLPLVRRFPRAGVVLVAALRFVPLVRRDARGVRDAQRARGIGGHGRLKGLLASGKLASPLLVRSVRRGVTAGQSLQANAWRGSPRFPWGPVTVLTALAAAGRLAFVWTPNVTPAFLVVFVSGVAYGARAGVVVGALSMVASNVLLSGLHPILLVNAPAMALLGAAGGLLRHVDLGQRREEPAVYAVGVAALVGVVSVLAFSVVSDTLTFTLFYGLAEGVWDPPVLGGLVVMGLVFNALPAAVNGALFAVAVPGALRALSVAGLLQRG